jgi:hypothetical protein
VNDKLERIWKKAVTAKALSNIHQEALGKTTKTSVKIAGLPAKI